MIPDIPSRRISEGLGFCDHKLGRNVQARQKNYRNWFVGQDDASDLTELRNGLQTGTPVGNKNSSGKLNEVAAESGVYTTWQAVEAGCLMGLCCKNVSIANCRR